MFSGDIRRMATVVTADDQATGTLKRVQAEGDQTSESLDRVNRRAQGLRTGFMVAAGATAALGAALGALVMTQGRAEQTFSRLAEVSGATADQMERVENKATDIGANLPVSIGQAAGAMEQLAFAGFTVEEQLGAANQAANLAVASGMNMQESARQTASLLNMFAIEAGNAQQVTATLAATFASSATNMTELSRGLSRVGQIATQTGLQLSEMTAAMGVLADQGIRAARAGQGLRSMLTRLVKPTSKAEEALAEANVELEAMRDAEGNFRSLNAIVQEFAQGLEGVENNATRARIITEAVGREGARALIPLINNQEELNEKMGQIFRSEVKESLATLGQMEDTELENLNEATELDLSRSTTGNELATQLKELEEQGLTTAEIATQLEVALGISSEAAQAMAADVSDSSVSADQLAESLGGATTAADIAASQMDTTRGAITFLKSSIDTMAFAIFSGASPAIQALNEKLAAGINVLNNNEAAMKAVGTVLVALTGLFATLSIIIGGMYLSSVISASIANGFLSGTFIATALTAGTLTGAMYALAAGIWAALAPVLPFVAAGLALVGVFYLLYEAIQANFLGVGEDLNVIMSALGDTFGFLMPILEQTARLLWNVLKVLFVIAAAPILAPIFALIKGLRILIDVLKWSYEAFMDIINGTRTFGQVLSDAGDIIFSTFANLGSMIINAVTGIDWAGVGMMLLKGLALGLVYAIGGIPGLLLVLFWDEIIGTIMGIDWANVGISIIQALTVGLIVAIFGIPGLIGVLFHDQIIGALMWVVDSAKDVGGNIIDALVGGLLGGIPNVGQAIDSVVSEIAAFLPWSNASKGPLSSIMSVGSNIISALVDGLLGGVSAVADAAAAVGDAIIDAIPGMGTALDIGGKIAGGIADGVKGAAGMVKGAGKAVADTVSGGMESATDTVKGAASDVAGAVSGAMPFSNAEYGPLSNIMSVGGNIANSIASGLADNEGTIQNKAASAMQGVMGAVQGTPLGQAVGGAAEAIGVEMPGGKQQPSEKQPSEKSSGDGVTVEINQTIEVSGDGDEDAIRDAAETGVTEAIDATIAELERLLQQDMEA